MIAFGIGAVFVLWIIGAIEIVACLDDDFGWRGFYLLLGFICCIFAVLLLSPK